MTTKVQTPRRFVWDQSKDVAKVFYFCYYAAAACLMPYLVLYYRQIGLSGGQIGLLAGIGPLVTLVAAPLWGGWADATRQYRRLLLTAILSTMIAVFVLSTVTSLLSLLPIIACYAFVNAPIMPLVDNSVMTILVRGVSNMGANECGALRDGGSLALFRAS